MQAESWLTVTLSVQTPYGYERAKISHEISCNIALIRDLVRSSTPYPYMYGMWAEHPHRRHLAEHLSVAHCAAGPWSQEHKRCLKRCCVKSCAHCARAVVLGFSFVFRVKSHVCHNSSTERHLSLASQQTARCRRRSASGVVWTVVTVLVLISKKKTCRESSTRPR